MNKVVGRGFNTLFHNEVIMMEHVERVRLVDELIRGGYSDDEIALHFIHVEDFDVKITRNQIDFIRRWSGENKII